MGGCSIVSSGPGRDGTTHIILTPLQMLEKLSALIPAPRAHSVRYAGVLAPAAKWRALIVPAGVGVSAEIVSATDADGAGTPPCTAERLAAGAAVEPSGIEPSVAAHGRNYTWAELMKRVWALDVLECPRCQGRMRILAAIHSPDAIGKILDCLGLPSRAPPVSPALREFPLPIQPF